MSLLNSPLTCYILHSAREEGVLDEYRYLASLHLRRIIELSLFLKK